jgi:hypothetical protein
MNPSPEQIAEWRETFEKNETNPYLEITAIGMYAVTSIENRWQGYLRARTEQATEIAALKAQIAELMPIAKFGALTLRRHRAGDGNNDVEFDELAQDAISSKVTLEVRVTEACSEFCSCVDYVGENGFPTICLQSAPNIEATIEQLLKD